MKAGVLSKEVRVGIWCRRQVKTMCNLVGEQKAESRLNCFSLILCGTRRDSEGIGLLPVIRQHPEAFDDGKVQVLHLPAVPVPVGDRIDLTRATVLINFFPPLLLFTTTYIDLS